MPINHYYCDSDGNLYFHSGKKGHKIDAIKRHDKVSFRVYDEGFCKKGEWALNIKSVIVFGKIEIVEDWDFIYQISTELSRKFTDDEEFIKDEIARSGPGTFMFALVPEHCRNGATDKGIQTGSYRAKHHMCGKQEEFFEMLTIQPTEYKMRA